MGTSEPIAARLAPVAASHPEILGLYVFGSHARGDAHHGSDVDLGALFSRRPGLPDLVRLEAEIEAAVGSKVDLVDAGSCNPFLALEIIRGERIYEADGVACDEFDLYVMRRAGDLWPFERERRRMLLDPDREPMAGRGA